MLAALPVADLARLRRHARRVFLSKGQVLFDVDEPVHMVYFPEGGLVSLVCLFEDGSSSEMAMIGKEGLIATAASLAGYSGMDQYNAMGQYVVQAATRALAVGLGHFVEASRYSEHLRSACASFVQALLAQALQTAACNNVHTVEERLARRLLMAHDRVEREILQFKQERLAAMLGVRRSTISVVAGILQNAGLISYRRGLIRILDRRGLENASCECYRLTCSRYSRLLPHWSTEPFSTSAGFVIGKPVQAVVPLPAIGS